MIGKKVTGQPYIEGGVGINTPTQEIPRALQLSN